MEKIRFVSDVLKEETRPITVRTEVENNAYKLKPGMFADADTDTLWVDSKGEKNHWKGRVAKSTQR